MPRALWATQVTSCAFIVHGQEHTGKGFGGTFSLVPAMVPWGSNGVLGSSAVGKVGESAANRIQNKTEAQFPRL